MRDIFEFIRRKNSSSYIDQAIHIMNTNPNIQDEKGRTLLMIAIKYQRIRTVKMLLSSPLVNVNKRDDDGNTALFYACRDDHNEILKLLLERNDILINILNVEERQPLYYSIVNRNEIAVMMILSDVRTNIAQTVIQGNTYLHYLILLEMSLELVNLCILKGVDINAQTVRDGNTALTILLYTRMSESLIPYFNGIVNILLSRGANPEIRNHEGMTFLHSLCAYNSSFDIVTISLLDKYPFNINSVNEEDESIFETVCFDGKEDLMDKLLEMNVELSDDVVSGVLRGSQPDIIYRLLEHGIYIDIDVVRSLIVTKDEILGMIIPYYLEQSTKDCSNELLFEWIIVNGYDEYISCFLENAQIENMCYFINLARKHKRKNIEKQLINRMRNVIRKSQPNTPEEIISQILEYYCSREYV